MIGLKISGTTKAKGLEVVTPLTDGSVPFGSGGKLGQDNANLFWKDTDNRLGIGTSNPRATLEVGGNPGASVGGFASGQLHVTGQSASINANSVITGHNLFGGNKQLWYFGSTSSSNDNIAFINRQNAALSLSTNSAERIRIESDGRVGIGTAPVESAKLDVSSTIKGFLPPRMTTTQRNAITSPAAGLTIYNTTTDVLNFFNGAVWGAV